MKSSFSFRLKLIIGLITILFLIVIGRIFALQIISGKKYHEKSEKQYINQTSFLKRGGIFFQRKDGTLISAATNIKGYKIAIMPSKIKDVNKYFEKINKITPLDKEKFFKKASKINDPYEEIKNGLTAEEGEKIKNLNLPGVFVYQDSWRFYPGERLGAHLIGFANIEENAYLGRYGLEKSYNDVLTLTNENLYINAFADVFLKIKRDIFGSSNREGDLITTIEPIIQSVCEKELQYAIEKWKAKEGGVIIIDPHTGKIYALAGFPNFNPNEYSKEKNISVFMNPLVEKVYEFGSVVKPLTVAAAIDQGLINDQTKYEDKGFVDIEDKRIFNFDKKGRGIVDFQTVLNESLNTGAIYAAKLLGKERMRNYFLNVFGFGEKTEIDLPGEVKNLTGNLKSPRFLEYANISFGQGISLTAVSLVRAFSVLANGGYLIHPHVGEKIKLINGQKKDILFKEPKRILKGETSAKISMMLAQVGEKNLRPYEYGISNYSIACKTGTAQIPKINEKGYYEGKYLHGLIGYFPSLNSRFLLFYYLVEPQAKYAIESLRDTFMKTVKFLITYYNIPPDK